MQLILLLVVGIVGLGGEQPGLCLGLDTLIFFASPLSVVYAGDSERSYQ